MDAGERARSLVLPEQIGTERLILRAAKAVDAPEAFAAVLESVQELAPWMPWVHPEPTLKGSTDFHQMAESKWATREMFDFQWVDKATGALIGKGGLHSINWEVPKFEIGYWVRTSMANRGYCTEAVNALIAFSQQQLGAKRLEICSDPRNGKSRRVAERCGFTLEGILRRNMRDPFGGLRDSCMYAIVFE